MESFNELPSTISHLYTIKMMDLLHEKKFPIPKNIDKWIETNNNSITKLGLKIMAFYNYRNKVSEIIALLQNEDDSLIKEAVIAIRKSKLPEPSEFGNAGSFFKNPLIAATQFDQLREQYPTIPHYAAGNDLVKIPAAWLIEQCGWKGKTLGGAAVYEKQPLVLINKDHATPEHIRLLAAAICESVADKFGITIEPEVNYI